MRARTTPTPPALQNPASCSSHSQGLGDARARALLQHPWHPRATSMPSSGSSLPPEPPPWNLRQLPMELPAASRLSACKPRPAPPLPHRAPASHCIPSSSTPCSSSRKTRRRPPSSSSQKELPDPELPPGAAPAWNNQGHGQEPSSPWSPVIGRNWCPDGRICPSPTALARIPCSQPFSAVPGPPMGLLAMAASLPVHLYEQFPPY